LLFGMTVRTKRYETVWADVACVNQKIAARNVEVEMTVLIADSPDTHSKMFKRYYASNQ